MPITLGQLLTKVLCDCYIFVLYFRKHPELQQKVEELQTGLRLAESHSLQLEEALQKSDKELQVLKGDNNNLKVISSALDYYVCAYTL